MNRVFFLRNELYATVALVVIIQIILMFQGFDICDDGFVLTFYQQIYSNPETVEYNFLYWFSGVFGGLWYLINEDGGVIWFRILGVVINTCTFIVSYQILKKYLSPLFLLLGLCMVLFVNDFGFLTFYHNHLTSFLTVIVVWSLSRALFTKGTKYFIIAGFLLVFNGLTRLPNFILVSLFLGIPFYFYITENSLKKSIKPLLASLLGFLFGLVTAVGLLIILGQLSVMVNALRTMMDVGSTEGSSHNFIDLFKAQYFNYKVLVKTLLKAFVLFSIGFFGFKYLRKSRIVSISFALIFGCLSILWFSNSGIFSIYILAYLACIFICFNKKSSPHTRTLSLFSFLMLFTMTIGTGGGIKNSGYMAIWLGFPMFFIAFPLILNKINALFFQFEKSVIKSISNKIIFSLSIAFLMLKTYNIFNEAYFDKGSRLDKTFAIHNKNSKYIYTTERRAKIVNELLENLNNYVSPNSYLFAYDHLPMMHFLTETKPYVYNPWPGIYDHKSFEKKIKKAEKEIDTLPIVVTQKFETIISFSEPLPDYMIPEKNNSILHGEKSIKLMNTFLSTHNYKLVWSNDYFNIYKTDERPD